MTNQMLQHLLVRLPEAAKAERELISTAFGIVDGMKVKADAIRADRDLSDAGKAKRISELASGSPLGHLRQIRSQAAAMSAQIDAARAKLTLPAPDKSDLRG